MYYYIHLVQQKLHCFIFYISLASYPATVNTKLYYVHELHSYMYVAGAI